MQAKPTIITTRREGKVTKIVCRLSFLSLKTPYYKYFQTSAGQQRQQQTKTTTNNKNIKYERKKNSIIDNNYDNMKQKPKQQYK